jgi:hypothetical protein
MRRSGKSVFRVDSACSAWNIAVLLAVALSLFGDLCMIVGGV